MPGKGLLNYTILCAYCCAFRLHTDKINLKGTSNHSLKAILPPSRHFWKEL